MKKYYPLLTVILLGLPLCSQALTLNLRGGYRSASHAYETLIQVSRAEVELATLTWVDWYNNRRLLGRLGHTPPAEAEKAYYASIGNNDLAA